MSTGKKRDSLPAKPRFTGLLMTEALKYSLRRERPYQGNGTGSFFQSGGTSFPSEHSAIAWSAAGVIAHEVSRTTDENSRLRGGVTGELLARARRKNIFPRTCLWAS